MLKSKKPLISKISHELVYLSLLFIPLQALKLPFFSHIYESLQLDISTFLLMISLILSFLCNKINKNFAAILILLIFVEALVFLYFSFQPYLKFYYYLLIYSFYLAIYFLVDNYTLDKKKLFNIVLCGLVFTSALILIQIQIYPNFLRPKGFMNEPTTAGLLLFSGVLAGVIANFYRHYFKKITIFFLLSLMFFSAIFTRSLLIIPFFILLIISFSLFYILKPINKIMFIKLIAFASSTIFFLTHFNNLYYGHIAERLFLDRTVNFSLLSYLACFDQVKTAIELSPYFGLSVGSMGYFPYVSANESILSLYSTFNSNAYDAYSLFFRLIIEFGLFLPLILVLFLIFIITKFIKLIKTKSAYEDIFLFFNSASIIVFCLSKGASVSHGYLFTNFFIFLFYIKKQLKNKI